jgi:predicted enzyme related to lactoylglutathione lyase
MSLSIQCFDIDSSDPQRLARFWADALGWRITHDTESEAALEPPEGGLGDGLLPDLLFLKVPEEKSGKNRLHFDLRPDDQDAEVARLESLGATRIDIGQGDTRWVVMADPEGNEFCVLGRLSEEHQAEIDRIISAWHRPTA